jgi:hypothetical protein
MYMHRHWVPQDYVKATYWLRKAADVGLHRAQLAIGAMYASGRGGLPQDFVTAYMWFDLAASHTVGNLQQMCTEERDRVAENMSAEQIAEAQHLARCWKPTPDGDK